MKQSNLHEKEIELIMDPAASCSICNVKIQKDQGFVSSEGVVVCSEKCREEYMRRIIPKLTVYSRVTGYLTPVNSWNKGKLKEFSDRKRYNIF